MKKSDLPAGLLQPLLYSLSCKIASSRARIHQMSKGVRQLYDNFRPEHYQIDLAPSVKDMLFNGTVTITGQKVGRPSKRLTLHQKDLIIINAEVIRNDKKGNLTHKIARINHHRSYHEVRLHSDTMLFPGKYTVKLTFKGKLTTVMQGIYPCKFTDKGEEKIILATQFEAPHAREAFPCIDEPEAKATFQLSLTSPNDQVVLSNTPIEKQQTIRSKGANSALIKTTFETTPMMSTYLLAFVIGDLHSVEAKTKAGIIVRSWGAISRPKDQLQYSVDEAVRALDFFSNYFGIAYPLTKLDQVALPDFDAGAMENWGLVTYRETALLADPNNRSISSEQFITMVICHELSHQWFGNLVTMKWWDDLWLNESFATYMANKVIAYYFPEWDIWSQYVTDTVFEGMGLDSLKSSHPIKVTVKNTSELEELFDEIAYEKGGSILRMLDLYLGEKVFREGLKKYIKKYQYKNAEAKDLWSILEKKSDKPVVEIMQKFIKQVGFPKISVREKNNVLFFQQRRFLFEGKDEKSVWKIPLVLRNGKDIMRQIYLPEKKLTLRFNPKEKLATINHNYSGFSVSDYSSVLLKSMAQSSRFYSDSDKIGLIHDLFALILAGEKNLEELFYLINTFFSQENSSIVLHYIIAKLTGIYLLLRDERSKKFATQFSKRVLDRIVGYEPKASENILETFLRVAALSSLTLFNDNEVAFFVNKKFISYLEDEKSLHSDLRSIVYSSAIWFDDRNYKVLKKSYEESIIQEEKAKLLTAMGFSKNRDRIKETLEYIMSPKVPFAFLPYAVSSASRNPYAKEDSLDWLIKSWPRLIKSSGGLANMLLRKILKSIVPVCGVGYEKEIEKFLRENKISGLERTIDQTLEELRINSRFAHRYKINIPSMSRV